MEKIIKLARQYWFLVATICLGVCYLVVRLTQLTLIPVFADEAIYIYWSQLIIGDWSRYLWYPLNDGKTPLFMWLMIPVLKLIADPLWAGRLVSVLFGLGQLLLQIKLTAMFTKNKRLQLLAGVLVVLLPGFIFNQRLALIDSALTFWLTLTWLVALKTQRYFAAAKKISHLPLVAWWWLIAAGVSLTLSLWTKFSALMMIPALTTLWLYFGDDNQHRSWRAVREKLGHLFPSWHQQLTINKIKTWSWRLLPAIAITLIGLAGFYGLKIAPPFSQIFARGGDFLQSREEFMATPLEIIGRNLKFTITVLGNYVTGILLLIIVLLAAWCYRRDRRSSMVLLSGLALLAPIIIFGKLIYPRYFLPALPFLILSFTISLTNLNRRFFPAKVTLMILIAIIGSYFQYEAITVPADLPLLPADRNQYFEEWSAGYGIKEAAVMISQLATTEKTLVLTEGHIGTLPDGLQIYFFNNPIRNQLRIEGIGQPVKQANLDERKDLINEFKQVILVVNSHRLEVPELQPEQLLVQYPRPDLEKPTLQVWRIK